MRTRTFQIWVFAIIIVFLALSTVDSRHGWDWIYTHWLFDYHFGFMKRGLVGQILDWCYGQNAIVPLQTVKVISWLLFTANTALVLYFFDRIRKTLTSADQLRPLLGFFAFCILSPLFLRNYSYDLGRFDQISSLLLLAQWFHPAPWITAVLSVTMVLIHENYIFIFLPTILLLIYWRRGLPSTLMVGFASLAATLFVMKFGAADTDIDTIWAYIQSKANAPLDHNVELLYWNLGQQLEVNKGIRASHLRFLPGFFFYLLWCLPLLLWLHPLRARMDRWSSLLIAGFVAAYAIIFVLSDWVRSTGNLFFTLSFIMMYLVYHDRGFRDQFFKRAALKHKALTVVCAACLMMPAAGVDIPRIYKFYELIHYKVQQHLNH